MKEIILVGGAEDKNRDSKIIKYIDSKLTNKKILIISVASSRSHELADSYRDAFRYHDVECKFINTYRRENTEKYIKYVEECDAIFMTGGNQSKLYEDLRNTLLLETILKTDKIVIGSSAGSMVMSEIMIKNDVHCCEGFSILKNIMVDTHFDERNRYRRLFDHLKNSNINYGIGIDENTAAIIKDNVIEVIGRGKVIIINKKENSFNVNIVDENNIYTYIKI